MKRNSKAKVVVTLLAQNANNTIVSTVTSDKNSGVTVEQVKSEIVADELITADMKSEGSDGVIITVEAIEELKNDEASELIAAPEPTIKSPKTANTATPVVLIRNFSDVAAMDKAAMVAKLTASTTAKKIIEKAENLIAAVESGKRLSRYTSLAVKALVADGSVSSTSLTDTFTAAGLGLGTARSQAQQMTSLFKLVGLTTSVAGLKHSVIADLNLAKELAGMTL